MKLKLIDDWKSLYKRVSVWLAAFAATITALLIANQGLLLGLVGMLPGGALRYFVAGFVAALVFIIPALTQAVEKVRHDGQ